jgi:hypothetical protein
MISIDLCSLANSLFFQPTANSKKIQKKSRNAEFLCLPSLWKLASQSHWPSMLSDEMPEMWFLYDKGAKLEARIIAA